MTATPFARSTSLFHTLVRKMVGVFLVLLGWAALAVAQGGPAAPRGGPQSGGGPPPQSDPQKDERVYDIGPGITPPRVTHQVAPVTKPDSRGFRLSGTVVVGLVVSSRGEPRNIHVVKSLDKEVDQTAVDAVRQWTFEPARKGDQPVAVRISVEIRFHSL